MKRGQLVLTVGRGDFSTKPRPSLIIQSDLFNEHHPSFTVCPVTSVITGDAFYRIPLPSNAATGLRQDSEVEIDLVQAIRRERVSRVIGGVPDDLMTAVDDALRRWLSL